MEFEQIAKMLRDEQVETRLEAVRGLSRLDDFDESLFVQALGDADWRVRKEAIGLFLHLASAGSRTAFIVEQLRHPENAGLRNAAIEILISLGVQGTPELLRQLAVSDAEVRKFIVDILGEIGHPACVGELLSYLRDEDDNVRYAVVETLGKLRANEAVNSLLDLLESADAGLRFTILDALSSIGAGVPVERLLPYSNDRLLRKSVFACLGQLGNLQALGVLIEGLSDPLRKTREVALLAIGQLISTAGEGLTTADVQLPSPEQAAQVVEYLEHPENEFKRAACGLLSLVFDREIFLRVLPLLADESLRVDVVSACKRVPPELLKELLASADLQDEETLYLIFIAGELKCSAVLPLALQAISATDPQLRYAAVMTLGKIAAKEALKPLGERLADEIPDIREAASVALRQLGALDPIAVIQVITPSFESELAEQRLLAVRTLGGLERKEVEDYLLQAIKDVAPEVRCEALRSLKGGSSQRLLTGLSIALTDENPDVRRLAAEALEVFPANKGLAVLEHVLDDPDPWVRTSAIRVLQSGQTKDVVPLLERGLADPVGVVVIAAMEAMVQVLADAAQPYLLQSLDSVDPDVVKTAVSLLLRAGQVEALFAHQKSEVRLATVAELQLQGLSDWQLRFEQQLIMEVDPDVRKAIEDALRRGTAGV